LVARTKSAPDARQPDLTIVTVVIRKHYGYIRQQLALIDALNPGQDFTLIVVDNAAKGRSRLRVKDRRCQVVPGIDASALPEAGRGSYHHAAALNSVLGRVKTRFLAVLDPDLFVLYRNWIGECLDHMRRRDLAVFGVPWNYASFRKWRYFPCVHFMLLDLTKLDVRRIDFSPAVADDRAAASSKPAGWFATHAPLAHARALLESRRDTGWRLHRALARRKGASDVVLPVIDIEKAFVRPKYLRMAWAKRLERRLPRRWSFLPAAGTYVEPAEAPGLQHPAIRALAPESFVWRGAPFALHLRRNMRDKQPGRTEQDAKDEQAVLDWLLERVAASESWLDWAV
jgi:hypothetical protein